MEDRYQAAKSDFFELLKWHLFENGTRPDKTTKIWASKQLAEFIGDPEQEIRKVNYWLSDDDPKRPNPESYPRIETALFGDEAGDDEIYKTFRMDFRIAYHNSAKRRARRTPSQVPKATTETASETVASDGIRALDAPRQASTAEAEFTEPAHRILYAGELLPEVALLMEPFGGGPWLPRQISWRKLDLPYQTNEFWSRVDLVAPVEIPNPSDDVQGKHIRLVAASQRRASEEGYRLDCIWQPISWRDSCRTNQRLADDVRLDGAPLWAWFDAEDLLLPAADRYTPRNDVPLANRLAINLAVILRSKGEDWALFQERAHDVAASPRRMELGASESVHGVAGWDDAKEKDVHNDQPDILRTARRCIWQELGLAERGSLRREIPTFEMNVQFTALVLNKREMSPRLLGFIEVWGSLDEAERASRESIGLSHREFGERPDKDAVPWERIRACPVTREAFASIFRRLRNNVSPECRARLLYYLKVKFPQTWHVAPKTEAPPPWL